MWKIQCGKFDHHNLLSHKVRRAKTKYIFSQKIVTVNPSYLNSQHLQFGYLHLTVVYCSTGINLCQISKTFYVWVKVF